MASEPKPTIPRLHVIATGGSHQYPHFLPIAFELTRRGTADVEIFILHEAQREAIAALAADLGYAPPRLRVMRKPALLRALFGKSKTAALLWWARQLRHADALLCAERTSSVLKRVPGRCPTFIHSRHGFGDRAVGFEERIAAFDHVLVAGRKDFERLVAEGRTRAERCHIVGSVKLAAIARQEEARPALFANDRPVILYNPHSAAEFSSFAAAAARLIADVVADGRYNLIVAPHIKLACGWTEQRRHDFEACAVPDRVIIDLASPRLVDMTYTLAAHCYVGDVSSQIYEFLVRPRPCLFIDAHDADWRDNPDYAMWHLGPVLSAQDDLIGGVDHAFASHEGFRAAQVARMAGVLADNPLADPHPADEPDDIDRAATLLERLIRA